jgi:hypothetical protein
LDTNGTMKLAFWGDNAPSRWKNKLIALSPIQLGKYLAEKKGEENAKFDFGFFFLQKKNQKSNFALSGRFFFSTNLISISKSESFHLHISNNKHLVARSPLKSYWFLISIQRPVPIVLNH